MAGIALGDAGPFSKELKPILSDASIFGVDLYEAGLGEKVEAFFSEMVRGQGAVRSVLTKYAG
jgi:fructuronate reductase